MAAGFGSRDGLALEKFMENCVLCGAPHVGARKELLFLSSSWKMCDELITIPMPRVPALLGEEEELVRREGWVEGLLSFVFFFSSLS